MFEQRRDRLCRALREKGISQFLITSPHNVTYLTGFTGDDSFLFVNGDSFVVWSDARYDEQLREECPGIPLLLRKATESLIGTVARWGKKLKFQNVHVEAGTTTVAQWEALATELGAARLATCHGIVEQLRERKDETEIAAITRAIDIAQRAFVATQAMISPESTEKNIADSIESNIRQLGGECSAFKSIVGVGPRAALPHGRPSSKKVHEDAFVLIDWGAKERLYLSDLTRVIVTSKPTTKFQRVYQTVLDAQKAAIKAIRPGVLMSEVDGIARGVIEQAGFGKRFTHSLGHSFGLQIHETIRLAQGQDRPLEPDMVVTVEPGIYIPGLAGVRIEDDVLVTKDSCRVLTSLPKEWDEIIPKR